MLDGGEGASRQSRAVGLVRRVSPPPRGPALARVGALLTNARAFASLFAAALERPLALLDLVRLDDVTRLDVGVVLQPDAAFEAAADLGDVVLEAP